MEMFMPQHNLGLREYAVTQAIRELQSEHDLITYDMIGRAMWGASRKTVQRAMRALREAGIVTVVDGSAIQGGYRYDIDER